MIKILMREEKLINNNKLLDTIYEALFRKKANDVVLIDLSGLENAITNYFIICDADSNIQVRAIADSVEELVFANHAKKAWHKEGYENCIWILLDYEDIIVHIFQKPIRNYYRLEELWADGIILNIEDKLKLKV
jgi:ribosome-associated protein